MKTIKDTFELHTNNTIVHIPTGKVIQYEFCPQGCIEDSFFCYVDWQAEERAELIDPELVEQLDEFMSDELESEWFEWQLSQADFIEEENII